MEQRKAEHNKYKLGQKLAASKKYTVSSSNDHPGFPIGNQDDNKAPLKKRLNDIKASLFDFNNEVNDLGDKLSSNDDNKKLYAKASALKEQLEKDVAINQERTYYGTEDNYEQYDEFSYDNSSSSSNSKTDDYKQDNAITDNEHNTKKEQQKSKYMRDKKIDMAVHKGLTVAKLGFDVAETAANSDNATEAVLAPVTETTKTVLREVDTHTQMGKDFSPITHTAQNITAISSSVENSEFVGDGIEDGVKTVVGDKVKRVTYEVYDDWREAELKKVEERRERKEEQRKEKQFEKKDAEEKKKQKAKEDYANKNKEKQKAQFAEQGKREVAKKTVEKNAEIAAAVKDGASNIGIIAAAGAMIIIVVIVVVIMVVVYAISYPFSYITTEEEVVDDEGNISVIENHEENEVGVVIQHYHQIINQLIDNFNAENIDALFATASQYNNTGVVDPEVQAEYNEKKASYDLWLNDDNAWWDAYGDAYIRGEIPYPSDPGTPGDYPDYYYSSEELFMNGGTRGPIFEGFTWSEDTDGTRVPKGIIYNEMLAALATYNVKCWNEQIEEPEETEPPEESNPEDDADDSGYPPIKFEYLNDDTVSAFYDSMEFWKFSYYELTIDCEDNGQCCQRLVTKIIYDNYGVAVTEVKVPEPYCPGHYVIECLLELNFDMNMVFDRLKFNGEDMNSYSEILAQMQVDLAGG